MKKIDWNHHIANQPGSGLSVAKYCQKHDLSPSRFYQVRKKASPEPAFSELSIRPEVKRKDVSLTFRFGKDGMIEFSGSTSSPDIFRAFLGGWVK